MMLDKQNMFSEAQSVAAVASTIVSTNSVDLGAAGTTPTGASIIYDIGRSNEVKVFAQVTTAVTSGGSATVQVQLIHSDNADLSSPTVLVETAAIAVASLVAGYQFRLGVVPVGVSKRYLGMQYVIATATTTAGKITSGIVLDKQTTSI